MSKRKRGADALAMQKVVINCRFGGFGVAQGYGPFDCDHDMCRHDMCRMHPDLISAIERDGAAAVSGNSAKLVIDEVPVDIHFRINNYDGFESLYDLVPKRGLDVATTLRLLEWIRKRCGYE